MKKEQISDSLALLDDDIIEETGKLRSRSKRQLRKTGIWAATAACLALLTYAGYQMILQRTPDNPSELPLLPVNTQVGEGMGFEGVMAFDISELVNANPWNEDMALVALPVYQNTNQLRGGAVFTTSGEEYTDAMREFLLDIAIRLGLDASSLAVAEKYDDYAVDGRPDPTALVALTDGVEIHVGLDQRASVSFDPPVVLPDQYHYTFHCSYEDCAEAAEYLMREYSQLLGMDNPQINISGGDYNIEIDQSYTIYFYDASGDDIDQIINYNFYSAQFCGSYDGALRLIWIDRPDLSQKVGDYPIITADAARELLCSGSYITSVPYTMPGADYIRKVELIYRANPVEEYFMPYYRFYVELPEEKELSSPLNTYGAYYVPAIDGRYLTGMPVWNGNFN
ncbi:MAG: hypothetical protein NC543_05605 [bacterium]|nr:hypothetical protein [bacterium]MCM1374445.1 hypothetical protein [Muribaculum sp.]